MDFGNVQNLKLNDIWRNEASDFTPWISERIEEIGALLGYEFEHTEREAPVGDFSLDILAKDLGTNRVVVIENQYEKNKAIFDALAALKGQIETEYGKPLVWERLDERRASRIVLEIPGSIEDSVEALDKVRAWMVESIILFKQVFPKIISRLKV